MMAKGMTEQEGNVEPESEVIKLQGAIRPVSFTGHVLADNSTEKPGQNSWTELEIYLVTKGPNSGYYMFYSVGVSLLYHKDSMGCGKGVRKAARNLTQDSVPCPRCKPMPASVYGQYDMVRIEEPRHTVVPCATPEELFEAIREGSHGGKISGPGESLLHDAAETDERIAAAMSETIEF